MVGFVTVGSCAAVGAATGFAFGLMVKPEPFITEVMGILGALVGIWIGLFIGLWVTRRTNWKRDQQG